MVLRIHVRFDRYGQLFGRSRDLTEDGLAADDDDLVVIGDRGCRAYDVLESFGGCLTQDSPPRSRIEDTCEWAHLSQRASMFAVINEERSHLIDGTHQDLAPCFDVPPMNFARRSPSFDPRTGTIQA
jgi:hypothetical protein